MPFAENLGTGGGSLDAQYGSSPTANTNAPLLLDPRTSGNFVYTPGTAGNYVAVPHSPSLNILGTEGTPFLSLPGLTTQYAITPDDTSLDITGDIDIRAFINPRNLTADTIISKWSTVTGDRSYEFLISSAVTLGGLRLLWTTDGSGTLANNGDVRSTAGIALSTAVWVRVTLDVDDGAGNNVVTFYTSPDGVVWTVLGGTPSRLAGSIPAATTTSVYSGTAPLCIGSRFNAGTNPLFGDIYRAQVRNGINGTVVFDADFTQQALGSRGFIESTGKLVSLVGNAAQIVDGTTYGFLPGVAGSYWSAPDSAALSITGDIDIRARISLNDWTPAADTMIVAKLASTGNQRSYALRLTTGGTFYFTTSPDGITGVNTLANAANTLTNGQTYWIRGSLDVDDGAGNRVANFYYAPDSETEPTVWTQIGTTVTVAGATSIFDGTAALEIGSFNGGQSPAAGRVYRAIIRGNLTSGTKAFDADFTRQLQFASTFTEGSANLATVTTQGTARIERDRDLEVVARVALDTWTPSATQIILGKYVSTGDQRSYLFQVLNTGALRLTQSTNGTSTNAVAYTSSIPTGFTDGQTYWVKAVVIARAGTSRIGRFFYAPDSPSEPTAWTQLGTDLSSASAFSMFPSTAPVEIGSFELGSGSLLAGKVHAAIIRNGIDGPAVLDIDFTDAITTGAETYLPDTVTEVIPEAEQFLPNLGWGGTALNARFGSAVGADTNDPLLLTHTGENYLYNGPGTAVVTQNCVTVPDSVALQIVGDIDLRFRVRPDSWTAGAVCLGGKDLTNVTRSYAMTLDSLGRLLLHWSPLGTDASTVFRTSTTPVPFANGVGGWVRATLDVDDGSGQHVVTFYVADDSTTEPVSWSQLGAPVTTAGTTSIFAGTQLVAFGFCRSGSLQLTGRAHRMIVRDGIGGTVVLDINTAALTSGDATTFTATTGQTATIVRSTSGRKSVAVVQDVLLFGTDDYLEVPDNSLLDFGASDSFTVMTAVRQWATPASDGRYLAKQTSGLDAGYLIRSGGTSLVPRAILVDGVNADADDAPTMTAGALSVIGATIDRSTSTLTATLNGVAASPTSPLTTGSLANSQPLRLGVRSNSVLNPQDFEFRGSAIWRRALTAAEVALVSTHYATGPTAASTALMQQAVWWVDAGTRSVAQINRSTSGRKSVACARCTWLLGTDDFFEVTDSPLWDFAQGQDYTLLVLHRGWWAQGTNDTLLATSSSTTASAAGWAVSNSSGDPWEAGGRHGDGSNGVTAVAPRRDVGALTGTFLVRDTATDTLTAFTGSSSGTPVTDTTTGTIGNTNVMRLGRLSTTGAEYLDAEVVAAVVWRRKLTTAERNAVLAYYGV